MKILPFFFFRHFQDTRVKDEKITFSNRVLGKLNVNGGVWYLYSGRISPWYDGDIVKSCGVNKKERLNALYFAP